MSITVSPARIWGQRLVSVLAILGTHRLTSGCVLVYSPTPLAPVQTQPLSGQDAGRTVHDA